MEVGPCCQPYEGGITHHAVQGVGPCCQPYEGGITDHTLQIMTRHDRRVLFFKPHLSSLMLHVCMSGFIESFYLYFSLFSTVIRYIFGFFIGLSNCQLITASVRLLFMNRSMSPAGTVPISGIV